MLQFLTPLHDKLQDKLQPLQDKIQDKLRQADDKWQPLQEKLQDRLQLKQVQERLQPLQERLQDKLELRQVQDRLHVQSSGNSNGTEQSQSQSRRSSVGGSDRDQPDGPRFCLFPRRMDSADGDRLPDECADIVWQCLSVSEQASASAASSSSRQAAPPGLRLAMAAQSFCSAATDGAAARELRSLSDLAAHEHAALGDRFSAVMALNTGLLRCQGAPIATRIGAARNLGRALRCQRRLPELFVEYDCNLEAPAEVAPALDALLWAAGQDQDKMRKHALNSLLGIAKTIAAGIQASVGSTMHVTDSFEGYASGKPDSAEGGVWAAAWARRQEQEVEVRNEAASFHRNPEAWCAARLEKGGTVGEVARFLSTHRRVLDGAKVGDFLGRHEDIMSEFIQQQELKGVPIVRAFADVLTGVQMPGEAQQVDRFCESFGGLWGKANDVHPDNAYIFAFSLVMLSTDLHRPSADGHEKMSFAQFERNLRGALSEPGLPESMLREAYEQSREGALFVSKNDDIGPADICRRLHRTLCCSTPARGVGHRRRQPLISSEDSLGLWRTIWSAAFGPLLGAFTLGAAHQGGAEDQELLQVALRGFQVGCQAAGLLGETVQAEAFSNALRQLSPGS